YSGGKRRTASLRGMAAPRDNSIEAEGLVREFKKGPRAVDGIDLRVEPGEIYGFLGPNGAGKSTTVHMLTTLLPPTAATPRVAGFDVVHQGPQVRRRLGPRFKRLHSIPSSPAASTCGSRRRCTASRATSGGAEATSCCRESGLPRRRTGR